MFKLSLFLKNYYHYIIIFILVLIATALIELWLGRSFLGPDGKFGFWEGGIWNNENSQRLLDPYSFSHIVHGLLFYAGLWVSSRKLATRFRFLIALMAETLWEIMENSPIIIERYRAVTISLGYVGDSVINSLSDILMMAIGFLIAYHAKKWVSVVLVIIMEVGCLLWIRDNLLLNIIMLVHPVEAIKQWQMAIAPTL